MSKESKYQFDVCPECKVKEGDPSKKTVYQCPYCGRWFCERHLEPRLALFKDFVHSIKNVELRTKVEKEWRKKDGHPDYAYTRQRLRELEIETKEEIVKLMVFLDITKTLQQSSKMQKEAKRYDITKSNVPTYSTTTCPKCGSINVYFSAYDENYEYIRCMKCKFKWKNPKKNCYFLHKSSSRRRPSKKVIVGITLTLILIGFISFFIFPRFNLLSNLPSFQHLNPSS